MMNFLRNLAAKTAAPQADASKGDKPAESCATDKSAKDGKKEGGCCGGHCH